MAETHVISALTRKRAELLGEVQHYEKLLKQSKDNLTSIRPKRVHTERYFKTGESKILILDILRTATEPLSTNEIGAKIASDKGIDKKESYNSEKFCKIILASLGHCEESKLIERIGKEGKAILWQIKKD